MTTRVLASMVYVEDEHASRRGRCRYLVRGSLGYDGGYPRSWLIAYKVMLL